MRHRKRSSKKKTLLVHARHRAADRYDFTIGKYEILEMAQLCRSGQYYCHLGLQSLTRSKIVLNYAGELIPVIYDKKRHCLVTILTMDMLSRSELEKVHRAAAIKEYEKIAG